MGDLLGNLSSAARSLDAISVGLQVVGQNFANAGTAGYSRRVVDYVAVAPTGRLDAGGGVLAAGIRAPRDLLMERQLLQEQPMGAREAALAEALGTVEVALGDAGQSIDARLSAFFDSFGRLADEPTSGVARQEVVVEGEALADAFRQTATRLDQARADAYVGIGSAIDDINALVERMAQLNAGIVGQPAGSGARLQATDELWKAAGELAQLVNVRVITRGDGALDVTLADGHALVIGVESYGLSTSIDGTGRARIESQGADVTAAVTAGRLGGLLSVRDTLVPEFRARLDDLAAAVVTEVNSLHQAGFDLSGRQAGAFFAPPGPGGAAASMAVDPAVAASPGLVGAAAQAFAGDNGTARAIAALRDARVLEGGTSTFHDSWANLVYRVGREAASAADARADREATVRQLEALKDQVSGVSLDEEAANLQRLQRAYEANARFFTTIDRTLDVLMQMVAS